MSAMWRCSTVEDLCDRIVLLRHGRLVADLPVQELIALIPRKIYQIRVKGLLDQQRSVWFDGLAITHDKNGETLLSGPLVDQAALHSVLLKIRDLGLPLLGVTRAAPGLNEVFKRLS